MRAWIIAAILLLATPLAIAVENAELYQNGQLLQYAPLGEQIPVELRFEKDAGRTVFIEYATQDGIRDRAATNCEQCSMNINLLTAQTNTFRYEYADGNGQGEFSIPLTEDTRAPQLVSWNIGGCTNQCSVGSDTTLTFVANDLPSIDGLAPQFFQVTFEGAQQDMIGECEYVDEGLQCQYQIRAGGPGEVAIRIEDVAGNPATESIALGYDNIAPEIEQVIIAGNQGEYGSGQTIVVQAVVRENIAANAQIILPEINEEIEIPNPTGTCGPDADDTILCSISFNAPMVGSELDITAEYVVRDRAGNEDREEFTFTIVPANPDTEVNFWNQPELTIQGSINPFFWRVAEARIPVQISLSRTGAGRAEVVDFRVPTDCQLILDNAGNSLPAEVIGDPVASDMGASFIVKLAPLGDTNYDGDSLLLDADLSCEFEVITKSGGTIFTLPESDVAVADLIYEGELPMPAAAIQEQLDTVDGNIQRQRSRIEAAQRIVQMATAVCTTAQRIEQSSSTLETVGYVLLGAGVLTGGTTTAQGHAMDRAAMALQSAADAGKISLGPICQAVTCSATSTPYGSATSAMFDAVGPVGDTITTMAGVDDPSQLINPYSSVVVAAATYCVPAIMYHLSTQVNNECILQNCLQNSQVTGISPSACRASYSRIKCEYVAGSAYHAVPLTHVWTNTIQRFENAFTDPVGSWGFFAGAACGGLSKIGWVKAQIPWAVRAPCGIADLGEEIQQVGQIVQQGASVLSAVQGQVDQGLQACESYVRQTPVEPQFLPFGPQFEGCMPGMSIHEVNNEKYVVTGHPDQANSRVVRCTRTIIDRDSSTNDADFNPNLRNSDYAAGCVGTVVVTGDEIPQGVLDNHQSCHESTFQSGEIPNYIEDARQHVEELNDIEEIRQSQSDGTDVDRAWDYRTSVYNFEDNYPEYAEEIANVDAATTAQGLENIEARLNAVTNEDARQELAALIREKRLILDTATATNEDLDRREERAREGLAEISEEAEDDAQMREYASRNPYRTALSSASAWAGVNRVALGVFQLDLEFVGVADGVREWIGDRLGTLALEEGFTDRVCESLANPAANNDAMDETIAQSGRGAIDARLAARGREITNAEGEETYQYIIEAFLNVRGEAGDEAILTTQPSINDEELGLPRSLPLTQTHQLTGGRAILFEDDARLNQVCIRFPEDLGTYFRNIPGGPDPSDSSLCAEVNYP